MDIASRYSEGQYLCPAAAVDDGAAFDACEFGKVNGGDEAWRAGVGVVAWVMYGVFTA